MNKKQLEHYLKDIDISTLDEWIITPYIGEKFLEPCNESLYIREQKIKEKILEIMKDFYIETQEVQPSYNNTYINAINGECIYLSDFCIYVTDENKDSLWERLKELGINSSLENKCNSIWIEYPTFLNKSELKRNTVRTIEYDKVFKTFKDIKPTNEENKVNGETLAISYYLKDLLDMYVHGSFNWKEEDIKYAISIYNRYDIKNQRKEIQRDNSIAHYEITLQISDKGRTFSNKKDPRSYLKEDLLNNNLDRIYIEDIIAIEKL